MVGWLILGLFTAFIGVLLARALAFRPLKTEPLAAEEIAVNEEQIIDRLAQMIRCRTVSHLDPSLVDETEFEKFRQLLPKLYPNLHRLCPPERIGPTGLLYKVKGKSDAAPIVFMAHYDVVPAEEEKWDKPAFAGIVEDGQLWGRGALDMKAILCGV
ncbi:MAG: M20/M25/M40 family metallo-hydrolase, partial [Clostridiales bacterium]|nr:M20/M25/M40 family metallo-hydrolase [Clostridiales bacterium]